MRLWESGTRSRLLLLLLQPRGRRWPQQAMQAHGQLGSRALKLLGASGRKGLGILDSVSKASDVPPKGTAA